jgi:hypothetical protein
MHETTSTIERAFELARSGSYAAIADIRRQLKIEGFSSVDQHFSAPTLVRQLRALLPAPAPAPASPS